MLAALHAMAALAEDDRPLSELLAEFVRFSSSGEINSTVTDQEAVVAELETEWSATPGVRIDHLDGLTVATEEWWFNVRESNTTPLLRLHAEHRRAATMLRTRVHETTPVTRYT